MVLLGRDRSLVGILTDPQLPPRGEGAGHAVTTDRGYPAVLILNAGFIHRIGPNRLHVRLARRLSKLGFPVLRFDFSGIGDSPPSRTAIPFDRRALDEAREAMDFLQRTCGAQSFIPVGICSGADVGFAVAQADDRVIGAILINGGVFGLEIPDKTLREAERRIMARYYRSRLWDLKSWARLMRGRSNLEAIRQMVVRFFRKRSIALGVAGSSDPDSSALHRLKDRGVEVLAVYSEGSIAWDILHLSLGIDAITAFDNVRLEYVESCDHVFTPLWAQTRLLDLIAGWATGVSKAQVPATGRSLAESPSPKAAEMPSS